MASQWYYAKGEERIGPVSSDDLKRLAASGELKPDDLIWKEGLDDWKPASQLKGLFAESAAPPTPHAAGHPAFWQVGSIIAAVLLIAAMFLPWWSFRLKGKAKDIQQNLTEEYEREVPRRGGKEPPFKFKSRRIKPTFANNLTSSSPWYVRNLPDISIRSNVLELMEHGDKDTEIDINIKLWGWHTNVGLSAAFLGFAVLPISLVMLGSSAARRFSFASSFLAAYVSFVLVVMSLVWYFDSPGWDMTPISQGAHVGPYLAFGGGALLLVFGLLDGIFGLRAFRRWQNQAAASQK